MKAWTLVPSEDIVLGDIVFADGTVYAILQLYTPQRLDLQYAILLLSATEVVQQYTGAPAEYASLGMPVRTMRLDRLAKVWTLRDDGA